MQTKLEARLLYIGDEEKITDITTSVLAKRVENILKAYDTDMGYLIYRVSKPEIVVINIKHKPYGNEELAAKIKEVDTKIVVICICDKFEAQKYLSNQNIDATLTEPLDIESLLDIVKCKKNYMC